MTRHAISEKHILADFINTGTKMQTIVADIGELLPKSFNIQIKMGEPLTKSEAVAYINSQILEPRTKEQILMQAGQELEEAVAKYKEIYIRETGEKDEAAYFLINDNTEQSVFMVGKDYSDIFSEFLQMNILD